MTTTTTAGTAARITTGEDTTAATIEATTGIMAITAGTTDTAGTAGTVIATIAAAVTADTMRRATS